MEFPTIGLMTHYVNGVSFNWFYDTVLKWSFLQLVLGHSTLMEFPTIGLMTHYVNGVSFNWFNDTVLKWSFLQLV